MALTNFIQKIAGVTAVILAAIPARAEELSAAASPATPQSSPSLQAIAAQQVDTFKNLINIIVEFVVKYSFQVLGGVIVLALGWMVARFVGDFIAKILKMGEVLNMKLPADRIENSRRRFR